jgi:hypothetical protein
MDKWGHYSDTVVVLLKPVYEQWLNRRLMSPHFFGNDNQTIGDLSVTYYSGMTRLFDSMTYCLQPNTPSIHSTNKYTTAATNPATGQDWTKPFYFTMDLGISADISRFWIAPSTHSRDDRFWEFSNGSIYDFELWGTQTDFGEGSPDYIPADNPYWTNEQWKQDTRWRHMGRYYNKRPNVPGDTPGNYTTEPPNNYGSNQTDRLNWDAAWTESRRTREMGHGVRYLADGSGPFDNNEFYFPDAGMHFAITTVAVGPVRYVRWQINETWEQQPFVTMSELWYWGGIDSENK